MQALYCQVSRLVRNVPILDSLEMSPLSGYHQAVDWGASRVFRPPRMGHIARRSGADDSAIPARGTAPWVVRSRRIDPAWPFVLYQGLGWRCCCRRVAKSQHAPFVEHGKGAVAPFHNRDMAFGQSKRGVPGIDLQPSVPPADGPILCNAT